MREGQAGPPSRVAVPLVALAVTRARAAAAVVGVGSAAVAAAAVVWFLIWLPVSILLLPVFLAVVGLSWAQAVSARKVWRGVPGALPALVGLCAAGLALGLFAAGVTSARIDLDGVHDEPSAFATAVALVAVLPSALGLALSVSLEALRRPATLAVLAGSVLVCALLLAATMSVPG